MSDDLDPNAKDRLIAATRGALAAVPFAGGLLGELVAEVIPGLRQDRIVAYLRLLEERVAAMEAADAKAALANPEKIDLMERGAFQAARATSPERIGQIVEVVARGLEAEEVEVIRRKRLLGLLGEIDEDEAAILTAYGYSYAGGDGNAFAAISRPGPPHMGAGREVIEQNHLYELGKDHLLRLGLLEQNYGNIKKGQLPEFDAKTGSFKGRAQISYLGRLLLREMGLELPFEN